MQASTETASSPTPPLRADAARNRLRILAAARKLMAERGSAVEMVDIAEEAGVGVGTLYRRFPDKQVLVLELIREKFAMLSSILERELGRSELSARERLDNYIRASGEVQRRDLGLQEAMSASAPEHQQIARDTPGLLGRIDRLVSDAVAEGSARADLTWEDIVMCSCALGHVLQHEESLPGSAERLLAIQLAGLDPR